MSASQILRFKSGTSVVRFLREEGICVRFMRAVWAFDMLTCGVAIWDDVPVGFRLAGISRHKNEFPFVMLKELDYRFGIF